MKLKNIFLGVIAIFIVSSFFIGQLSIAEIELDEKESVSYDILSDKNKEIDSLISIVRLFSKENSELKDSIGSILTFTPSNVKRFLSYYDVLHEDIVYNQSLLETGMFSSELLFSNNNLFGMKNPYSRATTSLGSRNGHAEYTNYIESIKDYKIFQDYYYNGGSYTYFLNDIGYAEDPLYIKKVVSIPHEI
jgi:flagellum-specific peptidoglycan hydrolase FlgJ